MQTSLNHKAAPETLMVALEALAALDSREADRIIRAAHSATAKRLAEAYFPDSAHRLRRKTM